MRFFILAILLAFPIMEIAVLIQLCQRYGWWVLLYLLIIGALGLRLIRSEKEHMAARMFQSLGSGGHPLTGMLATARNMLAGVLLLIPGVITDIIAVGLLLFPGRPLASASAHSRRNASANDDIIEGEFTAVQEPVVPPQRIPRPHEQE